MMGELEHVKLDFPFQSGTINPLSLDSAEQNNPVNCFVRGLGKGEGSQVKLFKNPVYLQIFSYSHLAQEFEFF